MPSTGGGMNKGMDGHTVLRSISVRLTAFVTGVVGTETRKTGWEEEKMASMIEALFIPVATKSKL